MLEVLRGYLRYFSLFSVTTGFLNWKCHDIWMDAPSHLLPFPHVKAFERSTKMRSLSIEHISWWQLTIRRMISVFHPELSTHLTRTASEKKLLHSYTNANDVKLKSLIWIAEERAFQSWHFHRPSKEVGYLCGSVGSFVKPERLCRLSGGRWTELRLQNISEYSTDLTAPCYHLHLTEIDYFLFCNISAMLFWLAFKRQKSPDVTANSKINCKPGWVLYYLQWSSESFSVLSRSAAFKL